MNTPDSVNKESLIAYALKLAKSELVTTLLSHLLAKRQNELEAIEIDSDDLKQLNLPKELKSAKVVKIPADFKPPLELHKTSIQITVILYGSLIWIQEDQDLQAQKLVLGQSIYTRASVFHSHGTGNQAAFVLALFSSAKVIKDEIKDFDWNNLNC